jgi:hypothetical protein
MFQHRLFKQTFKPTNTMNDQTGTQAPAQAGIEDFNGIFQERLRGFVREGLLLMFEQEVTSLCGESYRPTQSVHRRAGSEMVTIQTTSGKECISKRRVREMLPSGLEREVRLKSYSEVKRRTRVVGLFPSEESLQRLVTAVLVEISEARESGKSYLNPQT